MKLPHGSLAKLGVFLGLLLLAGCPASGPEKSKGSLTIYSGRTKSLVGPIIEQFSKDTGIDAKVRDGKTAAMAATILEEGATSPADVFLAQDAGALGVLSEKGLLAPLDKELLARVDGRFHARSGDWIGVSGRARVVAYSTERIKEADLPTSIWHLTDPKWKGRIGWPPANASFQSFITALRKLEGEDKARAWLEKMKENEPKEYPKNTPIIAAIKAGEIDLGLVNHYYLYRFLKEEGEGFPVRNHHLPGGDAGALINIAGIGILKTAKNKEAAQKFIEYLLGPKGQEYFANTTYEYPLAKGVAVDKRLKPLAAIQQPDIDLNDLKSLEKTLELLRATKVLQ